MVLYNILMLFLQIGDTLKIKPPAGPFCVIYRCYSLLQLVGYDFK